MNLRDYGTIGKISSKKWWEGMLTWEDKNNILCFPHARFYILEHSTLFKCDSSAKRHAEYGFGVNTDTQTYLIIFEEKIGKLNIQASLS